MKTIRAIIIFIFAFSLAAFADISGTVTNKTTGKPASGDQVTLLKLTGDMLEVGQAKTDAQGKFSIKADDTAAAYLIRVSHRNVNYHRQAPPGTTSVEVEVFDAAENVEGIKETVEAMRIEADSSSLRVIQMYSVENNSQPPRTQMSAKNFEVILPAGAKLQQGLAAGPGGMPVTSSPNPTGTPDHYAFLFPVRPGETRFQVEYTIPYSGNTTISPKLMRHVDNFGVSFAKGITLTPSTGSKLALRGEEGGMTVYAAAKVGPGAALGFSIKGIGTAPVDTTDQGDAGATSGNQANSGGGQPGSPEGTGKPGGGMANPVNTPNPLSKYQWIILAIVGLAMVAGAAWSLNRQTPVAAAGAGTVHSGRSQLMEALKEEMFKLESERIQEKLSPEEYQKVKAALDVVLQRAMKKA
jgi:hypothetical protein